MKIRTWFLLLLIRLLGVRWFPVSGPSVLILTGLIAAEQGARLNQILQPLDLRVIVFLPHQHVRVEAVLTGPLTKPT